MELKQITNSIQPKPNWRVLLKKWIRPAMIIGLGLAFLQQFTGINTIIYYAPTIFQVSGFHDAVGAISETMLIGVINVVFTIVAIPLIDSWGRRPLLLTGLISMFISLVTLSIAFISGAHVDLLRWLSLASLMLYIAGFAIGLGPIMWLVIAEIFPLEIRGLGSSLVVSASWGFNAIVALTFLTLVNTVGVGYTFIGYAVLSLVGIIFIALYMPETKGVSLEQIEQDLRAGVTARKIGQS